MDKKDSFQSVEEWENGRDLLAEITEGVTQMLSGANVPTRIVEVSEAIHARRKSGLSQADFAKKMGVSFRTYQEWEQGRREPTGAAKILLHLIARKPELLKEID